MEFIPSSGWLCVCVSPCARHLKCHPAFCKSLLTLKSCQTSRGDAAGLSKSHKVDPVRFGLSVTQADCRDSSPLANAINFLHTLAPPMFFLFLFFPTAVTLQWIYDGNWLFTKCTFGSWHVVFQMSIILKVQCVKFSVIWWWGSGLQLYVCLGSISLFQLVTIVC